MGNSVSDGQQPGNEQVTQINWRDLRDQKAPDFPFSPAYLRHDRNPAKWGTHRDDQQIVGPC